MSSERRGFQSPHSWVIVGSSFTMTTAPRICQKPCHLSKKLDCQPKQPTDIDQLLLVRHWARCLWNDMAITAQNIGSPLCHLSEVTRLNDTTRWPTQFIITPKPSWALKGSYNPLPFLAYILGNLWHFLLLGLDQVTDISTQDSRLLSDGIWHMRYNPCALTNGPRWWGGEK